MQINFELTSEDFRDAFHNFYLGSTKIRILLCIAVLAVSVTIYAYFADDLWFKSLQPLGTFALVFLIFIFFTPFYSSRKVVKTPALSGPRTVDVSDNGMHFRSSLVDSQLAWPIFVSWTETSRTFILRQQSRVVIPIPKRAMTEAQQQEFRALLQAHITARAKS